MGKMSLQNDAMSTKKSIFLENILPVMLGLLAFFTVVGWDILRFDNIRWLQQYDDSAQHYLGWLFYRNTPWAFPIGSNPNFGLEVGSSIFYSDSIPILALFFKLLSPLLPEQFQYFGLWYLLCFVLQAWFAFRLVGIIRDDLLIKVCATGLFIFSPPMLNRLVCHSSLVGHWLILAALYFCLTGASQSKKWQWLAIAVIASLTHAYLLAMVMILWASDVLKRLIGKEQKPLVLVYEFILLLSGVFFALWQAGYFIVKSGQLTEGFYGIYKMNLLSLVNPSVNVNFLGMNSFSYILPDLPLPGGEFEGFNFLGLGSIGIFIIVIPCIWKKLRRPGFDIIWWPLLLTCLGLFLFAVTNKVGIGSFEFTLWIPEFISPAANLLRSSGRMFWPVFYLMIWCLLFLLLNSYKKNTALIVLLVALVAQVADTRAGWGPIFPKSSVGKRTWNFHFESPFWSEATTIYRNIRLFPPMEMSPIRFDIAYLAGINKMGTDAADLARYDSDAQEKLKDYYDNIFNTGNYDKDTLYVFDERYLNYAIKNLHKDIDLVANIDGYYVVAPGWNHNHDSQQY
jgi:hypothetical protein